PRARCRPGDSWCPTCSPPQPTNARPWPASSSRPGHSYDQTPTLADLREQCSPPVRVVAVVRGVIPARDLDLHRPELDVHLAEIEDDPIAQLRVHFRRVGDLDLGAPGRRRILTVPEPD